MVIKVNFLDAKLLSCRAKTFLSEKIGRKIFITDMQNAIQQLQESRVALMNSFAVAGWGTTFSPDILTIMHMYDDLLVLLSDSEGIIEVKIDTDGNINAEDICIIKCETMDPKLKHLLDRNDGSFLVANNAS